MHDDPTLDDPQELARLRAELAEVRQELATQRAAAERFGALVERSSDLFWELDAAGCVTYLSARVRALLGYEPEALLGRPAFELMPPAEAERLRAVLDDVVAGRAPGEAFVSVTVREDGEELYLEFSGLPFFDDGGNLLGYRGAARDVTERLLARHDLERRLEFEKVVARLAGTFITVPASELEAELGRALTTLGEFAEVDRVYIFRLREGGRRFDCTHEWCAPGIPPQREDLQGFPASEFTWGLELLWRDDLVFVPKVAALPDDASKAAMQDGGVRAFANVAIKVGGELVGIFGVDWVNREATWLRDTIDLLLTAARAFANAIERQRIEAEREALYRQLQQSEKLEAIGKIAGGLAHDFNNQLTAIIGCAETIKALAQGDGPRPEIARFGELILLAAVRAAELTAGLLAFARQSPHRPGPVELGPLVTDTVRLVESMIGGKVGVRASVRLGDAVAIGDRSALQNALINLVINARDALPSGGTISIVAEPATLEAAYCAASPFAIDPGRYARLSVIDDGEGIDHAVLPLIFDPFFTTKPQGQGTGLGLSTVYGAMTRHAGAIEVASTPGEGTRFTLLLPLVEQGLVAAAPGATPSPHGDVSPVARRARVLVVDDHALVRKMSVGLLEREGYAVSACASGAQAVERLRQDLERFDLVMLDMVMPELGGADTYKALRTLDDAVPIVLMSGYAADDEVTALLALGASGFLQKPFGRDALLRAVLQGLESAGRG